MPKYFCEKQFQSSINDNNEVDIMKSIDEIVKKVIQKYDYFYYENFDDLFQHARFECWKSLKNFNRKKGNYFNYLTKIANRSLLNYTTRKKKHRGHLDIEDQELVYENDYFIFDNIEERLKHIGDSVILPVFMDYLKTNVEVDQDDFIIFSVNKGYNIEVIKGFLKSVSGNL